MSSRARFDRRNLASGIAVSVASLMLFLLMMASLAAVSQSGHPTTSASTMSGEVVVDTPQVPILCYHYLRGTTGPLRVLKVLGYVVLSLPLLDDTELWTIGVDAFEKQMVWLHDHGYRTISLDDVDDWQNGLAGLPPRSVVITFDDGDKSALEHALPVLQRYGFQATVFLVTAKMGQNWSGIDNLTWEDVKTMQDSGVFTFESHTRNLHYKVTRNSKTLPVFIAASTGDYALSGAVQWDQALGNDLEKSRNEIRAHTGRETRYLAWPYGHGTPVVDAVAESSGFTRVCSMDAGINVLPSDSTGADAGIDVPLHRYPITARTSMREFIRILRGQADAPDV